MIREYAQDIIDEARDEARRVQVGAGPRRFINWAGEYNDTDRYAAIRIIRHFSMRRAGDVNLVNRIYRAYGLNVDFSSQAERAELYFREQHANSKHLNYVTIETAKLLANRVERGGFGPLLEALPEALPAAERNRP